MAGRWIDKLSFVAGAAMGGDRIMIVAVPDESAERKEEVSVLLEWQNGVWEWNDRIVTASPAAIASTDEALRRTVFLGYWGELYQVDTSGTHESSLAESLGCPERSFGPMRGLAAIEDVFFAAGMGRVVVAQYGNERWKSISPFVVEDQSVGPIGFQAIAGARPDDVYAVGFGGEIWHFDGTRLVQADSPTNLVLNAVHITPHGVFIAGKAGLILVGHVGGWSQIEQHVTDAEFFSLQWFRDRLYLATTQSLYTWDKTAFEAVDFGDAGPATCFHLFESNDRLWSVGPKDILCFDGITWTRIE